MTGAIYPYATGDHLKAANLNLDFEMSRGALPPSGSGGGAKIGRLWLDTSTSPYTLRQCVVASATAGVYVSAEWVAIARFDPTNSRFSLLHVKGNGAAVAAYAGFSGELVINTDDLSLLAQDGSTAGGIPVRPRQSVKAVTGTGAQTVGVTDDITSWTPASAGSVTFTLPASPRVGETHGFKYPQVSGQMFDMVVQPAAGTIDGAASITIRAPSSYTEFVHMGSNVWITGRRGLTPDLSAVPNILINPFMEIDQANEGVSVSLASGTDKYVADGWKAGFHSSTAVVTAQRVADGPLTFPNSLKLTVSTGATVAAGDYLYVRQPIEANDLSDWDIGAVGAQPLAVTFWAKSSIAGYVMSGAITNFAGTRGYPVNFTITSANTWQQFRVIIPGDVAGTWVTNGTAGGAYLYLVAAAGASFQGAANTWAAGNALGTSSNTNSVLSTSGATFQVTVAKLEVSPVPTPLNRRAFSEELRRCQRHFQKSYDIGTAVAAATRNGIVGGLNFNSTNGFPVTAYFDVDMRAVPSMLTWDGAGNASKSSYYLFASGWTDNIVVATLQAISARSFLLGNGTTNATFIHYTADARL